MNISWVLTDLTSKIKLKSGENRLFVRFNKFLNDSKDYFQGLALNKLYNEFKYFLNHLLYYIISFNLHV